MMTLQNNTTKLAAMTCTTMLLAAGAPAADQEDAHRVFVESAVVTAGDERDPQMVEVRVVNDDVLVKLNGKEVPAARLKRTDEQVIVLDEDGNEIRTLNLRIRAGSHPAEMWFGGPGEGTDHLEWVFESDEEPRAMLGVALAEPGPALLHHLRLEPGTATMVSGVYEGLPAADAGIEVYDVIVEIDGKAPADPKTLRDSIAVREPGERLRLAVIQKGSRRSLTVELTAFDREALTRHAFRRQRPGMMEFRRLPGGESPPMGWSFGDKRHNRLFFVPDGANEFHSFEIPKGTFEWSDDVPFGDIDVEVESAADYESKMRRQIEALEEQLAEMSQMLERMLEE